MPKGKASKMAEDMISSLTHSNLARIGFVWDLSTSNLLDQVVSPPNWCIPRFRRITVTEFLLWGFQSMVVPPVIIPIFFGVSIIQTIQFRGFLHFRKHPFCAWKSIGPHWVQDRMLDRQLTADALSGLLRSASVVQGASNLDGGFKYPCWFGMVWLF